MFDYVGRDLDEEAGKRRLWSALITFSLVGLTIVGSIALTAITVKAVIDSDQFDLDEMIEFVTEEMEFLGPMRLSEVEEVQLRIVQQVRQLEEQGQVTIARGDSDDQFV